MTTADYVRDGRWGYCYPPDTLTKAQLLGHRTEEEPMSLTATQADAVAAAVEKLVLAHQLVDEELSHQRAEQAKAQLVDALVGRLPKLVP